MSDKTVIEGLIRLQHRKDNSEKHYLKEVSEMKKGNMMVKRIAMVIAAVAIVAGAGISGHMTAEAAKTQMMEISCPHCHEYITVDVMQDDVECTNCFENIHIDG